MATARMSTVVQRLRRTVLRHSAEAKTDGQLLTAFIEHKDEAAFEDLARRHGAMVFNVCRRVVGNHHDAEDAFQATFLVLARKASSIRPREQVANWLHGVALRTALNVNAITVRRQTREKQVTAMPESEAARQGDWIDLQPVLDQELNGLPDNYRLPILLCDLEGKTIKDAAEQLGWPQGSLAGRLARGRKLLAKRLANRGVALSAGALAALVSEHAASAAIQASLMSSTMKAAALIAAGETAACAVPTKVAILMEGVLHTMFLTRLKSVLAILLVVGAVGLGGGLLSHHTASGQQTTSKQGEDTSKSPSRTDEAKVGKPKPGDADLDRLQGVWSVVTIEQNGTSSKLDKAAAVFMVDGKRACWQIGDSEMEGGLYLDPTKKPKAYDFAMSDRTIEGIYAFEGDTLRLCYDLGIDSKRPSSFTAPKGSLQVVVVLKRTKGPEVFPFRRPDGSRAFPPIVERRYPKQAPPMLVTTPAEDTTIKPGTGKAPMDGSYKPVQAADPVAVAENSNREMRPSGPVTVTLPNARITIDAGEKVRLTPVKTANGGRVRVEVPGITVEVPRLTIESDGKITQLEATVAGDTFTAKVFLKASARIGQIFIVGNTKTSDAAIRKKLPFFPGEVLDLQALRNAEKSLAALGATVSVIESESPLKDILIQVKE